MSGVEKVFHCVVCGKDIHTTGVYAKYCTECMKKRRSKRVMELRSQKNPDVHIGVGSGGHQQGTDNHCFIDGLSQYRKNYIKAHPEGFVCEICGSDRFVVIHHIDQNRKNNDLENLMPLCRSCHAQVHRVTKNLGNVPLVDMRGLD